ncbi:MAG: hypothetical protein IH987_02050 [Planctomycetes bacterium]|nr:hypothetical protein [Planctomycetota bacterium]
MVTKDYAVASKHSPRFAVDRRLKEAIAMLALNETDDPDSGARDSASNTELQD